MKESERNERKSAKMFEFWHLKLLILFKNKDFVCSPYFSKSKRYSIHLRRWTYRCLLP